MLPGDDMMGMRQPSFISLVELSMFSSTRPLSLADRRLLSRAGVPSAMTNVFQTVVASSTSALDANVLVSEIYVCEARADF